MTTEHLVPRPRVVTVPVLVGFIELYRESFDDNTEKRPDGERNEGAEDDEHPLAWGHAVAPLTCWGCNPEMSSGCTDE